MLLIFLSSKAFSLLSGSFGSFRFFSEGTSPARGWRCPLGASRAGAGFVALVDPAPLPVCAIAAGLPIRASNAIVVIKFRISLLLHRGTQSSADDPEFRWLRSYGDPVPHSPAPCARRPWCRATRLPPPPAPRRSRASPRSRLRGCPGPPAAPARPLSTPQPVMGSEDKGERRRNNQRHDSAVPDAIHVPATKNSRPTDNSDRPAPCHDRRGYRAHSRAGKARRRGRAASASI